MGKLLTFPKTFFNEYFSCVQFERSPGTGFPALENAFGTSDECLYIRESRFNGRKLYSFLNPQINLEFTSPAPYQPFVRIKPGIKAHPDELLSKVMIDG